MRDVRSSLAACEPLAEGGKVSALRGKKFIPFAARRSRSEAVGRLTARVRQISRAFRLREQLGGAFHDELPAIVRPASSSAKM